MQSTEERQEIPKEKAPVMPVLEPRKRRRFCNLAAELRQTKKERTRGNQPPPAGRCPAVQIACRKMNLLWNVQTKKKSWTVGGIDRHGQEDDPSCNSSMAQWKCRQEKLDQEPDKTRTPERTKRGGKAVDRPRMQQWHKEPRCWGIATSEEGGKPPRVSEDGEDTSHD
jgi:hypothetical protein